MIETPERHACTSCGEVHQEQHFEWVGGYPFCNYCVSAPVAGTLSAAVENTPAPERPSGP